jgi:hypothetical protein
MRPRTRSEWKRSYVPRGKDRRCSQRRTRSVRTISKPHSRSGSTRSSPSSTSSETPPATPTPTPSSAPSRQHRTGSPERRSQTCSHAAEAPSASTLHSQRCSSKDEPTSSRNPRTGGHESDGITDARENRTKRRKAPLTETRNKRNKRNKTTRTAGPPSSPTNPSYPTTTSRRRGVAREPRAPLEQ